MDFRSRAALGYLRRGPDICQQEWERPLTDTPQADVPRARLEHEYVAALLPYGLVPVLLPRNFSHITLLRSRRETRASALR